MVKNIKNADSKTENIHSQLNVINANKAYPMVFNNANSKEIKFYMDASAKAKLVKITLPLSVVIVQYSNIFFSSDKL